MTGKKRKIKNRPSPFASRVADAYVCGSCSSAVSAMRDSFGIEHVRVKHDESCPVLSGQLSDVPDLLRAAQKAGGVLLGVPDGDAGRLGDDD